MMIMKTIILFLLVLASGEFLYPPSLTASPIGRSSPERETTSLEEMKRGIEALAARRPKDAKKAFDKSLKLNPKQIGSILGLAEIAANRKDLVAAGKLINEALLIAPNNPAALISHGKILLLEKKSIEARSAFEKAVKKSPDFVMAKEVLGDFYLNVERDPQRAIALFLVALKIEPERVRSRFSLGLAYSAFRENGKALAEFEKAANLSPENPFILEALGRFQFFLKEYENALATFERLIRVEPKFLKSYIYRGDVYGAKREYRKAEEEYRRALGVEEKFAFAWVKIGMLGELTNEYKKAETAYMNAIKIDSKMAVAYNNLSWMMASRNVRLGEALRWAEKAVASGPKVVQFLDTLGWVHWIRGEKEEAVKLLEKAALADPPVAEVNYHLAVAYSETGNSERAIELLREALEIDKDFSESEKAMELLDRLGG